MPLRARVGRHARQDGRHAQNFPDDQQAVIALLNRIPAAQGGAAGSLATAGLREGVCGDALYRAIRAFEDKHWPGQGSGIVDPGGAMLKRMEALAAAAAGPTPAAGSIAFVMGDFPWNAPTAAMKVHAIASVALETHLAMYVAVSGDRGGAVTNVVAEPPTLLIETAGTTGAAGGGSLRWFKLSRPRGDRLTVKAKDATGAVLASFALAVVDVPGGPGPVDLDVDPQNPGAIGVRVYKPTADPDWIDTRMEGIGYNIYLGGFQVWCSGMSTPIDVPYRLVDLTLYDADPIDNRVHDTLAEAEAAIRAAPKSATGRARYSFYRGAGGLVIAPTVFAPATAPRIIATFYEARALYADYVIHALFGIAIGIIGGMVTRGILGRLYRKSSDDPVPPRRALPAPTPPKIKPVNGSVNVGGGGEIPDVTNLNPIKPGSGGPTSGIPNHVPAPMEKMGDIFEPGSVQNLHSIRLRYQDVDWPVATRAAGQVMPRGGKVEMNIWTANKQQVARCPTDAFTKAGFKVTSPGGRFAPGPGTIIEATKL